MTNPANDPTVPASAILEHIMNHPTEPFNSPDRNTTTGETPATGLPAGNTTTAPPARHPLRVGTLVWGAVVVVLGILVIVVNQAGLSLDAGQTAMWLLLGAGVAMVAGGAINLLQHK